MPQLDLVMYFPTLIVLTTAALFLFVVFSHMFYCWTLTRKFIREKTLLLKTQASRNAELNRLKAKFSRHNSAKPWIVDGKDLTVSLPANQQEAKVEIMRRYKEILGS